MPTAKLPTNLNRLVKGKGILAHVRKKNSSVNLTILSIFVFKKNTIQKGGRISISVANHTYDTTPIRKTPKLPLLIRTFRTKIPYSDLADTGIHNSVSITYNDDRYNGFRKPITYSLLPGFRGRGKARALKVLPDSNTTVYVRQSVRNRVYITQRRTNTSDKKSLNLKMTIAYYASLVLRWKKVIILFEKESLKYEESASVLYERLIDRGHKNIFFVLSKDSPHQALVADKYRKNILTKHSFKHYLYFFISNTFLGTEMPAHAIDLRVANKHAVRKIGSRKLKYVFLQHGVMYFVSLASAARKAARKGVGGVPKFTKTVVSSELEAQHFIDHGGYDLDDLYITGLPKFDRTTKNKDADKIVIMPTWRPWEYNQVRTDPSSTRYYKMLESIISSIPKKLHDKIRLMPHPLFIREIQNSDLNKYIYDFTSYDEILKDTDTLITDYSSVAADAFYRGSKVIFWWKEKDYCMEQYGGFLMLNEKNIFGDIALTKADLKKTITSNYLQKQQPKYKRRYKKIVEFNDSKNTDRLIELLIRDKIIDT